MIRRDSDVRRAVIDHSPDGLDDTADGADFLTSLVFQRRNGEKMPKQFVRAVDEVHIHATIVADSRQRVVTHFGQLSQLLDCRRGL